MSESAEEVGHTETFFADVESIDDVNDATRRFNSALDELRKRTNGMKARIVIAEVEG